MQFEYIFKVLQDYDVFDQQLGHLWILAHSVKIHEWLRTDVMKRPSQPDKKLLLMHWKYFRQNI